MLNQLVWGSPNWFFPALTLGLVSLCLVVWSYFRRGGFPTVRMFAAVLKVAAISALAACLIEPLYSGVRPRPGANLFLILADNSQSLNLRDRGQRSTRGEELVQQLDETSEWQTRVSQDFDIRRYIYDTRVKPVSNFSALNFEGTGSALAASLISATDRYRDRPMAGVLLFTDGNATDWQEDLLDGSLPPIYPVVVGQDKPTQDISISRVSVSQTNFEASPVTILVEAICSGYVGKPIVFQLLDEAGKLLQRHILKHVDADQPLVHRFLLRPEQFGISFYQARVIAETEEDHFDDPERTSEATLDNNTRLVMVDRGGGPFRILYVTGRPNWDFKFLRRALQKDEEVNLVGLVRVAKREPKFTFRGRVGERTNPLFRGFDNQEDEDAEQYDQPVLLRLGTENKLELRDGFPKAADQLFRYHALIIDDLDVSFFTQDQMSLIQEFISRRGGGFLMMGGRDAFAGGKYRRTPIGELLPVYVDPPHQEASDAQYRLTLTRDGWLQPWIRLRDNELDEQKRLDNMPLFLAVNRVRTIKPGAAVLAQVTNEDGQEYPALVAQQFGKGRSAALLVADMWRWQMRRKDSKRNDLLMAWRQLARWLVADVPGRIEVKTRRQIDDPSGALEISVLVRDEDFAPLDNASVTIEVRTPDDRQIKLTATASDSQAGEYLAAFTPRAAGAYRAAVTALSPDGIEIGRHRTGWASQPATEEFRVLRPNRNLLQRIAEKTDGELVEPRDLPKLINSLPNRKVPITEPWIYPLWHQWSVLIFAVSCLVGEWGLRRWKGLP